MKKKIKIQTLQDIEMKTLKQVEELTGIKADNLRQRISRKTIKAVKRGRDWFISETEIQKLLDPQSNASEEE